MKFSTPISTTPVAAKGDVGIRETTGLGIVSDLFVKQTVRDIEEELDESYTMDGFKRLFKYSSKPGYTDFAPFIEGYYNYQKALFKMTIQASGGGVTPQVTRLAVIIDVPDTIDTGQLRTDADEYILVKLNKHFYTIPTITATQISGTTLAAARVMQNPLGSAYPGNEYFYIALVTQSGDLIAGDVYWQAIGY